jgi:NAD(P)-dependent dehydrogenase (short-subunit alcohol dehydrogenase family)
MTAPVCLISGVGPGTGSALAKRFAEGGYRVALLARSEERLAAVERELKSARGYRCDVSDPAAVEAVASEVERELGSPNVVIHNAVRGTFGTFGEINPSDLNRNFQVNTMGLLYLARRFAPAMIRAGKGAIAVTGNTSALRGKPMFAGFAPTKAAQKSLTEAMARELGPQGVHDSTTKLTSFSLSLKQSRRRSGTSFTRIAAPGHSALSYALLVKHGDTDANRA